MNKIWLEQYPKSVPATIDVAAHASLVELLEAAFASHGQKVAYTFMGKSSPLPRSTPGRGRWARTCSR
jgi:hypothetical protein